jgi:hypothetical protein
VIVPDDATALPDGTRVRFERVATVAADADPPPAVETRAEFVAGLKQSVAEARAGVGGVDARQFLKQLAERHNLPLLPGE